VRLGGHVVRVRVGPGPERGQRAQAALA
jgi:hypothetical protein